MPLLVVTASALPVLPLLSCLDAGSWVLGETANGSATSVLGELKVPNKYMSTALASGLKQQTGFFITDKS